MTRTTPPSVGRRASRWHHLDASEVAKLLEADLKLGLSGEEVKRRRARFGPNKITVRRGAPGWAKFLQQFHAPLVYILLVASAITAFLGEWVDSSVIFGVVFINAIIGYLQEARAERAVESLAHLVVSEALVRRDGKNQRVHCEELVPGDMVLLQAGDRVPADVRLIHARNLQIDESALTGESVPAAKHPDSLALDTLLADRKNLAFSGTLVVTGEAEGVIWATGDETETGHIARLIAEVVDLSTPLTRKIAHFSQIMLWVILVLAAATFAIGVTRGEDTVEMFMAAVALAVGAIPEGLPAAVTIVLAIGVSRMARQQAIIRKLPAVETLGSTTVICSDKTGTLTENQMTVREAFAGGRTYAITGAGYEPSGAILYEGNPVVRAEHPALLECIRAAVLCTNATVTRNELGRIHVQGDPTEAALLVAGEKAGVLHAEIHLESPRMDMIPFDSGQMFSATLHGVREGGRVIYKMGASERLITRCVDALDERGQLQPINPAAVHSAVERMSSRGLRVLAFARRHAEAGQTSLDHSHVSQGLTFLGLQGMIDPPRPEAVEALRKCREAGITVKMMTGDHLLTACAIARQMRLNGLGENDVIEAVSGRDLEDAPDDTMPDIAEKTAVFARVTPEQKLRLVRALQSRGHVVAMTGDGVNDAPALKQADIGVSMGLSGTDMARAASAMVLADDNFASIQAAVEEGRNVFDNLTKFLVWTLPTNMGEGMILLAAIVLGTSLPALPVQLLWVNMMTAVFLGLMLVFEPKEPGLMQRPPRDPARPLLTFALAMRTSLVSLVMMIGAFWLFFWEMNVEGKSINAARTAVINVIVVTEIAYLFNCRTLNHSSLSIGLFSNHWAIAGSLGMLGAQLLFTYATPMNTLFHTAPVDLESWLRIALVAAAVFALVETEKWLRYRGGHAIHQLPE